MGRSRVEGMNQRFGLFGLVVRSEIPLPAPPAPEGDVDLEIRVGALPVVLAGALVTRNAFDADETSVLLRLEGVGRFWIHAGHEVVVDTPADVPLGWLLQSLLSSVMAVALQQRGVLTLHGSVVEVANRAVVIAGASGSGKSTLAGFLAARGHAVHSDGFAGIVNTRSTPHVLPGPGVQRLWPDSARYLGHDEHVLPRLAPASDKRLILEARPALRPALPVAVIYVLGPTTTPAGTGRLFGRRRAEGLFEHLFLSRLGWGRAGQQAARLLELVQQCPVEALARPTGPMNWSLEQLAAPILGS
jgi:energy-coupling factor transporter ATP-binding protein EcfA2